MPAATSQNLGFVGDLPVAGILLSSREMSWRPRLLFVVRLLFAGLFGCCLLLDQGCNWQKDQCPVTNCDLEAEGDGVCRGYVAGYCYADRDALIDDDGVICPEADVFQANQDCLSLGADCVAGKCVARFARCPSDVHGFCRDGKAVKCVGDRVEVEERDCSAHAGASCYTVTRPDGFSDGVCALADVPCDGSECDGNDVVVCNDGYPGWRMSCGVQTCQSGRCVAPGP